MNTWFTEDQTKNLRISLRVRSILHKERSAYQEIAVYETEEFGRLLTLDDVIMTTEKDEFVYHEMLSHPALCAHPRPRQVLVVGGGDGGIVREVLKHPSVERVVLAEIDERVIEVSKRYLPTIASALDDPRVDIQVGDGIAYVADHPDAFDVILVDSTDPIGPAVGLFGESFYRSVRRALGEGGLFAAQTESPWFNQELLERIHHTLREIFPVSRLYWAAVPTYPGGFWTFSVGSLGPDLDTFDEARAAALDTKYYSPEMHRAALALPPFVRRVLGG